VLTLLFHHLLPQSAGVPAQPSKKATLQAPTLDYYVKQ
jgi:hypothetical protein